MTKAKAKSKAKPAPKKAAPAQDEYSADERKLAAKAADALMVGFAWERHPWGGDFWVGVYNELERLANDE